MPASITCSHCGKTYRLKPEMYGRTVRCTCGQRFRIPPKEAVSQPEPPVSEAGSVNETTNDPSQPIGNLNPKQDPTVGSIAPAIEVEVAKPNPKRAARSPRKKRGQQTGWWLVGGVAVVTFGGIAVWVKSIVSDSDSSTPTGQSAATPSVIADSNAPGSTGLDSNPNESGDRTDPSESIAASSVTDSFVDQDTINDTSAEESSNATPMRETSIGEASAVPTSSLSRSLVDPPEPSSRWSVPDGTDWLLDAPEWATEASLPPVPGDHILYRNKALGQLAIAEFSTPSPPEPIELSTASEGFRAEPFVSADGQYVVGQYQSARSTSRFLATASPHEQRIVTTLESVSSTPRFVEYLSADRLLVVDRNEDRNWEVFLFRAELEKAESTFVLPSPAEPYRGFTPQFAISPGKRFLAYGTADGTMRIFEIASGTLAGELRFPKPERRYAATKLLAFSPNGQELAVWYKFGESPGGPVNSRIVVWEMTSGELRHRHDFTASLSTAAPPLDDAADRFVWLPDGSGWIAFGQWIIDKETGFVLAALPRPVGASTLQLISRIDSERLIIGWMETPEDGSRRHIIVRPVVLDETEWNAAKQSASDGIQPQVPGLPTNHVPDLL